MLSLPKHLLLHITFHCFVAEVLFIFLKNQVEIVFASIHCYFIWYVFLPSYLGRQKKSINSCVAKDLLELKVVQNYYWNAWTENKTLRKIIVK